VNEIDAVVFDVGGVLIDWNPEYLYTKLISDPVERRRFLTEVCTPDWNAAQDAGRSWEEAVQTLSAEHPHHAELIAAYDLRWEEMVAGPIPESVEVLEELRQRGIPNYALTNFSSEKWKVAIGLWPFLDRFNGVVVSGEEGIVKPNLAIYRLLLDRFDLAHERTFYLDDRPENVRAAGELGMQADLFTGAPSLRRRLDGLLAD